MVIDVRNLSIEYKIGNDYLEAVHDISFSLTKKESLGFVGESGCGKSTLAYALLNLLEENGRISNGEIIINEKDIVSATNKEIRDIRWKEIAMIFQNAMTALNPVEKIGVQITNALLLHEKISRKQAIERAKDIFNKVGISPSRLMEYPHEFSGGMKQRAVIALALICYPNILLADEPTTALDVVAQRQVLELLVQLKEEFNLTLIMISHDISVVAEACEKVAVMYGGEIMELGNTEDVFKSSNHPYTKSLINSFPSLYQEISELEQIPGYPPSLEDLPKGCPFATRCAYAQEVCFSEKPAMRRVNNDKLVKCHFAEELDFNKRGDSY
ncbi:ABC transporter ATP-binding protein [Virgibacillus halodenitrificans]|uniref:ABC transporter ATP-binding protein n=1 Tax=Virgibacillus halodenitrificans TaxID=1482 RepID=UPI00045C8A53|nr:ABC transporter ATP-binding protein [Virgibacillus halodenitrificans]CDQ32065.1 Stage 0 sporulation protein KD [Virgibacillus halodenitrificans]